MTENNRFIKIKIIAGYLFLVAILLFSIWFINHELKRQAEADSYETEKFQKDKALNRLLTRLYISEAESQSLITGNLINFPAYKAALKETYKAADTLIAFTKDSIQKTRIDKIKILLKQKEQNLIRLLKTIDIAKNDKLYRQNLEIMLEQQDSLLERQVIQKRVIQKQDSILNKKKKKGFFKRVAEVFSPAKDSIHHIYNANDTLVGALENDLPYVIETRQQKMTELINDQAEILKRNNRELNDKINGLIRKFDQEEAAHTQKKEKTQQEIKQKSIGTLGKIALSAVFITILLSLIIWRDLTRSNRYRRELEKARLQAEKLLEIREKLMLTITHDFKAPLSSIIGYIDLLIPSTANKEQRNYLENMKNSSRHLLKLVKDLLDFHRLEANKMDINLIIFNPALFFNEIKKGFNPLVSAKGLRFDYKITPDLNREYAGDTLRLRQITENLLSNALKFTDAGTIGLKISQEEMLLVIQVSDTGKGISLSDQSIIFQEFTRLKEAQGIGGFGLGLSITQKLCQLLEGDISLESTPGKGSVFSVKIPLHAPEQGTKEFLPEIKTDISEHNLNVLLIDDDKLQLELTTEMLKRSGIHSTSCTHPDELFEALRTTDYDLLLSDVQMPAMNGIDLLHLLRASNLKRAKSIKVIAVTARSEMNEAELLSVGFAGCLHKPFSLQELYALITSILIQKSNTAQLSGLFSFCEDDTQAKAIILSSFIEETSHHLNILEEAVIQKNTARISALAHKMLSVFTLIQAHACISILTWLEQQKETSFSPKIEQKTQELIAEVRKILRQAKE